MKFSIYLNMRVFVMCFAEVLLCHSTKDCFFVFQSVDILFESSDQRWFSEKKLKSKQLEHWLVDFL